MAKSKNLGANITEIRTITPEELDYAKKDIVKLSDNAYTLCETIRNIYALSQQVEDPSLKEDIQDKCVMVLAFAKRMNRKLCQYKLNTIADGDDNLRGLKKSDRWYDEVDDD